MGLYPAMHPACYVCTNIEIKITIQYNGPLYSLIIITFRRRAQHIASNRLTFAQAHSRGACPTSSRHAR
jgi:hypothetical protein